MDTLSPWETERTDYVPRLPAKAENITVRMFVDGKPIHMKVTGLGGQFGNPMFHSHMLDGQPCADWAVGEAKPGSYLPRSTQHAVSKLIDVRNRQTRWLTLGDMQTTVHVRVCGWSCMLATYKQA